MQTNSEHIHECNHPVPCPKICVQTNFGTVNMNSHNTHSSQMDNCGNRNQCWSLLLLISCCPSPSGAIYYQIPLLLLLSMTLRLRVFKLMKAQAHVRLNFTVST